MERKWFVLRKGGQLMFNRKHRIIQIMSIFLVLSLLIVGCGTSKTSNPSNSSNSSSTLSSDSPTSTEPNTENKTPAANSSIKVTLYFPTSDAIGLVPIEREVNVTNQEVIQAIFKEFSLPPAGLVAPLPKDTELLDAKVKDGVATLNLSKNFKNNFQGGATGEQMVLYSIVNTLTSLSNVKSVEFLLEGKQTVAILGGLDTSTPLKRNESLIVKK
jgi:germination protein M